MEVTGLENGNPVSSAAHIFLHLRKHNADPGTPIFSYFTTVGTASKSVISTNIVFLLFFHAAKVGFQHLGFYPHEIVYHSILSGGAMTLHQAHIFFNTIKIIGFWH